MAVFTIQAPDGRKIKIQAADEATAMRGAQEWAAANPVTAQGSFQPPNAPLQGDMSGRVSALSAAPPEQPRPDLMTATANTISGLTNSIPVLGPLAQGTIDNIGGHISQAMGGDFNDPRKRREELIERDPVAYGAGNIAGAVGTLGAGAATKLGAEALGMGGKLLPGMLKAGASNQALYTADQHARGNTGVDTLGMGLPAVFGAGGRAAGDAMAAAGKGVANAFTGANQRGMTNAAIKGAPDASDLAQVSRQLFKDVDEAGVRVEPNKFGQFVAGLVQRVTKERMNPTLDPKSYAAIKEVASAAQEAMQGGGLTVSDLHTLRQIAQKAAMSAEGRDARFANMLIEGLDDFVTKPGSAISPGGKAAGNELLKAISTWGRSRRVGLIEEAVFKAQNQASGLENGLRIQFRQLLQNPRTRKLFTEPELQAVKEVANGTTLSNAMRLIGKFGFGGGSASNMLGGAIGFGAGSMTPLGAAGGLLAAGAGTAARKGSEALASKAAERAAKVVATPGIPTAAQAPNLLEPARVPLDVLIRGGSLPALPGR